MNHYTFPFDTCEKTNENGIVQPYSAFVNIINCIIIFYFLIKTETIQIFFLLFCIFLFELFHVFSHVVHIKGAIQTNIIHSITYLVNIAFLIVLYKYTNRFPSNIFCIYLIFLVCMDIYSFFYLPVMFYILCQSAILISLLIYYFSLLPKFIKTCIYQIIFFVIIIILLITNEKYNCKKMVDINPDFPYHIFIEIAGIGLFYVICSNFYKLK